MTYIYSTDAVTIERTRGNLPNRFTRRLSDGAWSIPSDATAADFGWYPVAEVAQPSPDHVRSIVNTAPGQFTEQWDFDQPTADANADAADRDARRAELVAEGVAATLAAATALENQAATFAGRPDANNNAQALALVNDLKNLVVPAIAEALVDGMRRDVKIVRVAGLDQA